MHSKPSPIPPGCDPETLSALVDGELPPAAAAQALAALAEDVQARSTWRAYHAIGEALRSPDLAPCRDDLAFLQRLEVRLREEAIAAPSAPVSPPTDPVVPPDLRREAANAPQWRKTVGAGVFGALLATTLSLTLGTGPSQPESTLAKVQAPAVVSTLVAPTDAGGVVAPVTGSGAAPHEVMVRDPALDALLASHRQLAGHSALQRASVFLRNATFEGSAR